MKLDDAAMRSFATSKVFRDNTEKINALNFTADGLFLVSSSADDSIIIYDCQTATKKRQVNSKKYGVDLIQFTHTKDTAVHSSAKVDDTIRYLSLHDNKYIRYFPGHTKKVVCLCMSPLDDTFLSGSLDKTIRLWDLRSPNCHGLMHLPGRPVAAFDPEGLIFAAGINSQSLKLYDLRSFEKGPFNTFKLEAEPEAGDWSSLRFSPDGKLLLISSSSGQRPIRLVDSFTGKQLHRLLSPSGSSNKPKCCDNDACFSACSRYVLTADNWLEQGSVHLWNAETGELVASLAGEHAGQAGVGCVLMNPKFAMFATACTQLAFWVPTGPLADLES